MYNIDLYEENQGLRLPQFLLPVEFIHLKDWHTDVDWRNIGCQEILVGLEGLHEAGKKSFWRVSRQDVRDGRQGDEATEEGEHFPD